MLPRAVPPVAEPRGVAVGCPEDCGGPPMTPPSAAHWRGTWPSALDRLQHGVPAGGQGRRVARNVAGRRRCARPALRPTSTSRVVTIGGSAGVIWPPRPGALRAAPVCSRLIPTGLSRRGHDAAGVLGRTGDLRRRRWTAMQDLLGGGPDEVRERYDWADDYPGALPVPVVSSTAIRRLGAHRPERDLRGRGQRGRRRGPVGGERRRPHGTRRSHVSGLGRRGGRLATVPRDVRHTAARLAPRPPMRRCNARLTRRRSRPRRR